MRFSTRTLFVLAGVLTAFNSSCPQIDSHSGSPSRDSRDQSVPGNRHDCCLSSREFPKTSSQRGGPSGCCTVLTTSVSVFPTPKGVDFARTGWCWQVVFAAQVPDAPSSHGYCSYPYLLSRSAHWPVSHLLVMEIFSRAPPSSCVPIVVLNCRHSVDDASTPGTQKILVAFFVCWRPFSRLPVSCA